MSVSQKHSSQQITLNVKLRDGFRFESFYTKPESSNAEVVEILQAVISSSKPQQNALWGVAQSGKTHLLQACCAQDAGISHAVSYIPLRMVAGSGTDILSGLSLSNLIVLDDIDTVVGDLSWETALFDLINTTRDNNQHLLISSTQNPRMLNCILPDLASRLIWGGSYQLQALNDEDTLKALQSRAEQRGFALTDSVISYLHRRYPRDIESLLRILDKLDEESLRQKSVITIPFVKQVLD